VQDNFALALGPLAALSFRRCRWTPQPEFLSAPSTREGNEAQRTCPPSPSHITVSEQRI